MVQDKWFLYKIYVFLLILLSSVFIFQIVKEYSKIMFNYKLQKSEIILILSLFLIFPSAPSFTSWASSFGHISFFLLYLMNLFFLIHFKNKYVIAYVIISILISYQYELFITISLINLILIYKLYIKNKISKKNYYVITVSKIFLLLSGIYLLTEISAKNLGFYSKFENFLIILSKDFIYIFYSFYKFYGFFSVLFIIPIIYYNKKFFNFLKLIFSLTFFKKNLYPILGILIFIITINSGGYPFSLVEMHGRTTLIFAYFYIFLFIYFYINSKNKKKVFIINYFVFFIAYTSSAYDFVKVSKNQNYAIKKVKEFLTSNFNSNYKTIIYESYNKTMIFETDLKKYLMKKLNIKDYDSELPIYVINRNKRCFKVEENNFSLYLINNPLKLFLYEENKFRKILELRLNKNNNVTIIDNKKVKLIEEFDSCKNENY